MLLITKRHPKNQFSHLVFDSTDPIEDNGAMTSINVVDGIREAVDADTGEEGELRHCRGCSASGNLRHLHILEIHAGGDERGRISEPY